MLPQRPSVSAAAVAGLAALALAGCGDDRSFAPSGPDPAPAPPATPVSVAEGDFGEMVIANRGSGTISVLDAATGSSIGDFALPSGPNPPEPMYVVFVKRTRSVLVGDRANSRVVEFDADSYAVGRMAPTGAGVFHMWADPRGRQLWVNNDVDNTATVIDPVTFDVLENVPMPADLVGAGYKPHDVILDNQGRSAFVTLLGPDASDRVVKFDTDTFAETARAMVGKDPHVSLTQRNGFLYVPCQNTNEVRILDRDDLSLVTTLSIPGAHGAGMTPGGQTFYTANLTGGGTDALFAIDTNTNAVVGMPADAPFAVPHNLAISRNGQRLFVTHSGGAADRVSFYAISPADPTPMLLGSTTVGINPFGIGYVP